MPKSRLHMRRNGTSVRRDFVGCSSRCSEHNFPEHRRESDSELSHLYLDTSEKGIVGELTSITSIRESSNEIPRSLDFNRYRNKIMGVMTDPTHCEASKASSGSRKTVGHNNPSVHELLLFIERTFHTTKRDCKFHSRLVALGEGYALITRARRRAGRRRGTRSAC